MDTLSADDETFPVVFLEYPFSGAPPERYARMIAAAPGGSIYFPPVIVDSGDQFAMGAQSNFYKDYGDMVDASMARPPTGSVRATKQRVGDSYEFFVSVTNNTGVTLSSTNSAAVHAIVFEVDPADIATDTGRRVRATSSVPIGSLADGATTSFELLVDLAGLAVNWSQLHAVVLVDYLPAGGSEPYDMVQAAFLP